MAKDDEPNVVIQAMMTANVLKWPDAKSFIQATIANSSSEGVKGIGTDLIAPAKEARPAEQFTAAEKKVLEHGKAIYQELCFACHGPDGKGAVVEGAPFGTTQAPSLRGSKTVLGYRDGVINVVMHGLAGPVEGKAYTSQMVPMKSNSDEWIASVVSYLRHSFGNRASFVSTQDVARVRAATKDRTEPWDVEELRAALPQPLKNQKEWKLTASHNPAQAALAADGNIGTRFDTGSGQKPGMWFQIQLPEETIVTALELDSTPSPGDYPRGYDVELSMDGLNWGQPAASGKGDGPVTIITFAPAKTKFIRIKQTGEVANLFWSIHELGILQPSQTQPNAARRREAAKFE
jgi:mono/diheme cytochrome c family protein